jgi:hypothetical protein
MDVEPKVSAGFSAAVGHIQILRVTAEAGSWVHGLLYIYPGERVFWPDATAAAGCLVKYGAKTAAQNLDSADLGGCGRLGGECGMVGFGSVCE